MIMRRLSALFFTAALLVCSPSAQARKDNIIQVRLQIFKFTGSLPGETGADEPIWTTDDVPDKVEGEVDVFSRGSFEIGEDKLQFKDGRCFWNKKEIPIAGPEEFKLPTERIQLVYAPVVEMPEHGERRVEIKSKQPIQYFEKRADGLYELKEIQLATGLDIEITEASEDEGRGYIELEDLLMRVRSVEKREKIPGVNLSVGKPVLGEQKYELYFRLRPGKDYGVLITPKNRQGGLLVRLRASSTRSGTIEESRPKEG
jgi:hypothetical protein